MEEYFEQNKDKDYKKLIDTYLDKNKIIKGQFLNQYKLSPLNIIYKSILSAEKEMEISKSKLIK